MVTIWCVYITLPNKKHKLSPWVPWKPEQILLCSFNYLSLPLRTTVHAVVSLTSWSRNFLSCKCVCLQDNSENKHDVIVNHYTAKVITHYISSSIPSISTLDSKCFILRCDFKYIHEGKCCGQLWVWHIVCGQTCDGLYHFVFCLVILGYLSDPSRSSQP